MLAVLLLITLVLLYHPVLFTGRYYELTVQSIDYGPQSLTSVVYDDSITYDTQVMVRYTGTPNSLVQDYWDRKPRSILHWPRKEREKVLGFWLATEEEKALGIAESSMVRGRLLLKPGMYRIRIGERLIYYRRPERDGTETLWSMEIHPEH